MKFLGFCSEIRRCSRAHTKATAQTVSPPSTRQQLHDLFDNAKFNNWKQHNQFKCLEKVRFPVLK